ncbi:MAG: hypothetical protein Fur0018_08480 [Anaerolineales bacterium]
MPRVKIFRLLATGLCLAGGVLLGLYWIRPLTVRVDGQAIRLRLPPVRVRDALAHAGVWLRPEDEIFPPPDAPVSGEIIIRRARPVWIVGRTAGWHFTRQNLAGNILLEAGIRLFPGDQIWVDGILRPPDFPLSWQDDRHTLQVRPAVQWVVDTPQGIRRFYRAASGLTEALWGAGFPLFDGDTFVPDGVSSPSDGKSLAWRPAREIQVQTPYGTISGRVDAHTVAQALAQIGLPAQGLDYSLPPLDASLPADGRIVLVRVREDVLVEQTPLPFDVVYQALPDVEIGEIRVLQAGQYGVQAQRVRVRVENGEEVARTVEAAYLAQAPQDRVVGYGTLAVAHTVDTPEGVLTYWRAAQVYVTSYSPCHLGIPNYCNDVTASGQRLRKGLVAVTRRMYAALAGSQVYVPGYGIGTVADIGAGVPGREWLDVGYADDEYQSWHQTVTVYYLWPPPEDLTWLIP